MSQLVFATFEPPDERVVPDRPQLGRLVKSLQRIREGRVDIATFNVPADPELGWRQVRIRLEAVNE